MNELYEIIKRNEDGYTMAKYGNSEGIHLQMAYDIDILLSIIDNFTNRDEKLTIDSLLEDIYQVDNVTFEEMESRSTAPRIATARRVFYYIGSNKLFHSRKNLASILNKNRSILSPKKRCINFPMFRFNIWLRYLQFVYLLIF